MQAAQTVLDQKKAIIANNDSLVKIADKIPPLVPRTQSYDGTLTKTGNGVWRGPTPDNPTGTAGNPQVYNHASPE
jgi:hypothetical protein